MVFASLATVKKCENNIVPIDAEFDER